MTNMIKIAFIKVIREKKEEKKLTTDKVARMLGMSQPMYAQIEAGSHTPSLQVLFDMHEILGFDLKDIKDKVNQLAKVR